MSTSSSFPAPLRPRIEAFPGSRIREVANAGMWKAEVAALWFGEGDRPTPKFICDAAARAMAEGKTFYTSNSGVPELREAIARYATRLHGGKIGPERITVTASGVNAIMLTMQALVDAGDNVVMVTPVWPNCADAIYVLGGEVRRVPLSVEGERWRLDLDRLFAACDARTRAIFVNSPGNPTGWMASAEDHAALLEFVRKRHIWLVHPPSLADAFGKLNEVNMSGPASFAQYAGITAIEQGEGFVKEIVASYAAARDIVVQRLGAMRRVRLARPEAAFYAFFRVDGMTDSLDTAKRILRDTGVGVAPGIAFGPEGEGYLRLCFATQGARLSEALERLAPALS